MNLLAGLLLGIVIGCVIGYLLAKSRLAAADERARAAEQKAELIEGQLAERFEALSARALDASTARFLDVAEGRLENRRAAVQNLVEPLKETLARVEAQLRESDEARTRSHAALAEQVHLARGISEQLRDQTQALVTALRRPEARGRWGEMQLRRVVELAGMSARCDFDEQVSVAAADGSMMRPDMVVHLAGGKNIVVDSKVSLAAYLEAAEADEKNVRSARLDAHARHLRDQVDRLAGKAYWAALSPSPEFVILFIPGEAFLAPALERDPGLLEYALARRVHIATPTTLVTMLRTAQYAWQQAALSEHARAVFDLGRELYDRLAGLGRHVDRLGRTLTSAVSAYNQTVGALENRVLVSARRLNELGVVDADLATPGMVEEQTRALAAPELGDPDPGDYQTVLVRLHNVWLRCVTMIGTRPQQRRSRPPQRLRRHAVQLTARGGVLGLFVVSFLAIMLANWTGWTAVADLAFVAACAAAASYTKRGALLAIVVSPPAVFLAACLCAESLTAPGTLPALTGSFVTLGISAPWLFAGTALVIVVALSRGVTRL